MAKDKLAVLGGSPIRQKPFPAWPVFSAGVLKAITNELKNGRWDVGSKIDEFENKFAKYHDAKYCVATTSGTQALIISLKILGIGSGDEVLVPAYTYVAVPSSVKLVGAQPIFVDISPKTANINPDDLIKKVTRRTKAVIAVHFAGLPADMDSISEIAKQHNLFVIEDAAQAHGAMFRGRKVGALGHLGCFSFQQSKILAGARGGAIITNDEKLAKKACAFRNFGRGLKDSEYEFKSLGGNFRMTNIQAALLLEGLKTIEKKTSDRQKNYSLFTKLIKHLLFLEPIGNSPLPPNSRRSHYLYVMRYKKEKIDNLSRHLFIKALKAEGIPIINDYALSLDSYDIFKKKSFWKFFPPSAIKNSSCCPEAQKLCQEAVWLPQNIFLGETADVEDAVKAIEKIFNHRSDF